MNTGAREMAWFFDEYSKFSGFSPGVVTGKVRARAPGGLQGLGFGGLGLGRQVGCWVWGVSMAGTMLRTSLAKADSYKQLTPRAITVCGCCSARRCSLLARDECTCSFMRARTRRLLTPPTKVPSRLRRAPACSRCTCTAPTGARPRPGAAPCLPHASCSRRSTWAASPARRSSSRRGAAPCAAVAPGRSCPARVVCIQQHGCTQHAGYSEQASSVAIRLHVLGTVTWRVDCAAELAACVGCGARVWQGGQSKGDIVA
jgi:hypothetical protein